MELAGVSSRRIEYVTRRLHLRGWDKISVHSAGNEPMLRTERGGLLICSDGRRVIIPNAEQVEDDVSTGRPFFLEPDWNNIYKGPKIFGGLIGLQLNTHGGDRRGTAKTVAAVLRDGFIPTIHGDRGAVCGLQSLAQERKIATPHRLEYLPFMDPDLAKKIGFYLVEGHHRERKLVLNLIQGLTQEVSGDCSRFFYDLWYMLAHGVGVGAAVDFAAGTVERLSDAREAIIIA